MVQVDDCGALMISARRVEAIGDTEDPLREPDRYGGTGQRARLAYRVASSGGQRHARKSPPGISRTGQVRLGWKDVRRKCLTRQP